MVALAGTVNMHFSHCKYIYIYFLDSMFISVEDRTGRIRFSYNYSMNFTCSQYFITIQTGDTFCTRSYDLYINTHMTLIMTCVIVIFI